MRAAIETVSLIKLRESLNVGDGVYIALEYDSKSDKKARWTDGVIKGKYAHYFLVEYKIKGHPLKTSFKYQDLIIEKPSVKLLNSKEAIA